MHDFINIPREQDKVWWIVHGPIGFDRIMCYSDEFHINRNSFNRTNWQVRDQTYENTEWLVRIPIYRHVHEQVWHDVHEQVDTQVLMQLEKDFK